MNGQDLFYGLHYVNAEFIEEAETVTQLQPDKKILSLRRPVLIAAIIAMLLMLVSCAIVYVLNIQEIHIGQLQTWQDVFEYDPDTMITAFILRPMSASIICDMEQVSYLLLPDGTKLLSP